MRRVPTQGDEQPHNHDATNKPIVMGTQMPRRSAMATTPYRLRAPGR